MATPGIVELLRQRVVFADGAMGTMLYQHGAFLNTCFDELNLTNPRLVKRVHDGYVEAGSDFIETNTFGANEYKLARFGLADKVEAINAAAVEIARQSAGEAVLVAGAVGPLGVGHGATNALLAGQYVQAFARQIKALAQAGVDFLVLETFSHPDELRTAIRAAREVCDLPVVAQMSITEDNETIYGHPLGAAFYHVSREPNVVAVGLNCSIGPSVMLESLKLLRGITDKPIAIQPNAGLPQEVDGRKMYMCTSEYMAEYAKRFFEHGARIIGGCCGTTPDHIRQIVRAVGAMDRAMHRTEKPRIAAGAAEPAKGRTPVPLAQRSRIGAKLAAGEKWCSIELTPPKGVELTDLEAKVQLCAQHGIDAINVPDGPRASSRLSPLVTAVKVQQAGDVEAILHVCCRDKNILSLQADMLGAEAMGVKNVLIITGDPPKLGDYPDATAVFDVDSVALTGVVRNLNRGLDIGGGELAKGLSLVIGVGANPAASDLARETDRFRRKVDAGAEFAVTQPVFDPAVLLRFLDATAAFAIPVVAGIWPFTSYKNAEFMANEVPGVVVPPPLLDRMSRSKTREQGRAIGVEIAREMIEAVRDRVAGLAVSAPFGNVHIALATLGKIDISELQ